MFEKMLAAESVRPERLGYDRPSPKLLGFLAKHYGLNRYVPQTNNFVVFSQYWETPKSEGFANAVPFRCSSLNKAEQTHATLQNFYGGGVEKRNRPGASNPFSTAYGEFRGNTISQSHLQSLLKTADGIGKPFANAATSQVSAGLGIRVRTSEVNLLQQEIKLKSQRFQMQRARSSSSLRRTLQQEPCVTFLSS